jgi:hypothetical protein
MVRSRRLTGVRFGWLLAALLSLFVRIPGVAHASAQGVRVVDEVNVTVAREEAAHGLHGEEMTVGETAGRTWRSATGWFSYTLRIYEDTPLTVVCAFADVADVREAFDILVDDKKVATRVREPGASDGRDFKITLPFADTAGKSQVTITFRAHAGARTARLLDVRTVQEHLEQPPLLDLGESASHPVGIVVVDDHLHVLRLGRHRNTYLAGVPLPECALVGRVCQREIQLSPRLNQDLRAVSAVDSDLQMGRVPAVLGRTPGKL